uniref:Uncharacterized protein n=1 Tax=Amphimedon queenslandica TaxID=400682 RepID=A0A1X7UUS3_AMPQE
MVEIVIKSILLPSITNVPVPDIIERLSKVDSIENSWASLVSSINSSTDLKEL